ncbi:MAG: hypothetical protein RQ833_00370 [Sphingomonadaceae bacterium]|nr:hypothetical protein [Sphingomonadaceae bacterium]
MSISTGASRGTAVNASGAAAGAGVPLARQSAAVRARRLKIEPAGG